MKPTILKKSRVTVDETFLENINLITGVKIDYNRSLQSDPQIKALMVDETLSKFSKFSYIMEHGTQIQKWAVLQNLSYYLDSPTNIEKAILLFEKNYQDFQELLPIMGEGILNLLCSIKENQCSLTSKCDESLFRIIFRTLTSPKCQISNCLDDWIDLLKKYFSPECNVERTSKFQEVKAYINSSFSMNTLPERRKTAFSMIVVLLQVRHRLTNQQSQSIHKQAHPKALFFSNDLNPHTRLLVCRILRLLLEHSPNDGDLWKCVHEYSAFDKDPSVRSCALQIITGIYREANCESLFNELDGGNFSNLEAFIRLLPQAIRTFRSEIQRGETLKLKLISFLNRLIRTNTDANLHQIFQCYSVLIAGIISEETLFANLSLQSLTLQDPKVLNEVLLFLDLIEAPELKDNIKTLIFKALETQEHAIGCSKQAFKVLVSVLNLDNPEECSSLIGLLSRAIEESKWRQVELMIGRVGQMQLGQQSYGKMSNIALRLLMSCPYFLIEKVASMCISLMLMDRKVLELFLVVKEKLTTSKVWSHRRNYILLYFHLKSTTSFQFSKTIPIFTYASIINEKISLVKMEFLRVIGTKFSFLDPSLTVQKTAIRDAIGRLREDKDGEVARMAEQTQELLRVIQIDTDRLKSCYERNKIICQLEENIPQVSIEAKKYVKTQKCIKRRSAIAETRTSLNLTKEYRPADVLLKKNDGGSINRELRGKYLLAHYMESKEGKEAKTLKQQVKTAKQQGRTMKEVLQSKEEKKKEGNPLIRSNSTQSKTIRSLLPPKKTRI